MFVWLVCLYQGYFCSSNGYQLFIKENANAELPFGETNRRWKKQLSQEERNTFNARAKSACETFKKRLAEFAKVRAVCQAQQKQY